MSIETEAPKPELSSGIYHTLDTTDIIFSEISDEMDALTLLLYSENTDTIIMRSPDETEIGTETCLIEKVRSRITKERPIYRIALKKNPVNTIGFTTNEHLLEEQSMKFRREEIQRISGAA